MSTAEFIAAQKQEHSVVSLCRALDVSESGYYASRSRPLSEREREDERLAQIIEMEFISHRKTYGSPRLHDVLRDNGEHISRKRVIRLMQHKGLDARPKPKSVCTTQSEHGRGYSPNIVDRNFATKQPNRIWVGDITYVRTDEGWLYLATLTDLFSRRIVGWQIADHMQDTLPIAALQRAIALRNPQPGLVHHSDRGSQYASDDYRRLLNENGITQSMSRKANCHDNAVAESVFATIEKDVLMRHHFATRDEGRRALIDYIENFYNPIRKHSFNANTSPIQAEHQHLHGYQIRRAA